MNDGLTGVVMVTGTTDPGEIVAALTAIAARKPLRHVTAGYELWRSQRAAALRASR
jgi:hypothetical protein